MLIDYVNQKEEQEELQEEDSSSTLQNEENFQSVIGGTLIVDESQVVAPISTEEISSQSPTSDTLNTEEIEEHEVLQDEDSSSILSNEDFEKMFADSFTKFLQEEQQETQEQEELQEEDSSSTVEFIDYTEDMRVLQNCAYLQTYCLVAIIVFGALILCIKFIKSFF